MKFLRYSISLTSCFTLNYINHHSTFSEENNKGIMLISEDENVFNKSNMYEYYYNKSLIPLIKGLFESNYSNE